MTATVKKAIDIEELARLIEPLNDEIVIVRDTKNDVTEAGIILPEIAVGACVTGVVVKIGPGACGADGYAPIKAGDRVYFDAFSTNDIKIGDRQLSLVKIENCKCIINTNDEVTAGGAS